MNLTTANANYICMRCSKRINKGEDYRKKSSRGVTGKVHIDCWFRTPKGWEVINLKRKERDEYNLGFLRR